MLVFPEQYLEPQAQLAFAARWGEVSITPTLTYVEGYPGLLPRVYGHNAVIPDTPSCRADPS